MRYLKTSQDRGTGLSDNDPLSGVANLFDLGLVFIVGLLIALFGAYHLEDLLSQDSDMTIVKKSSDGQMEIISKKGKKIDAVKVTKEKAQGKGERLGTAYKLENGSMIYIPD
ncbi:MAG: DUF2149 domain-containing protein [Proteobacteria bacterium]|nr:DUF2149 domain-containing protein [Pseudomonadota bacterium]MBU1585237.1 DUF2149 domain-containing protein [Pseudomonadota bacterium]MBU2454550.1 DUF2149 domain-containing protein [Pseudomonadota bacterium]MBU2629127.1 DUF2149 domain-containing protein [Pseudomonadota bacterium]